MIFVPSDCLSGLLQPSDLSSLPDGRIIACPIRMSLYLFFLYNFHHLCFMCVDFYYLSALDGCWFVVHIRRLIYKFLNVTVFFWLHGCCGEWKGWAVNQVNHTSWVAVVTPTDRPKSVRNRCVIELFRGVVIPSQQSWRGYSNAAVRGWLGEWVSGFVGACVGECVVPSRFTLWTRKRLQFLPNHFQTSHAHCS